MNVNDVDFFATGGTQTRAIHNEGTGITISHVNITVDNSGGKTGIGIYNTGFADMFDIDAEVSHGENSFGVHNTSAESIMSNVRIVAKFATNNYGVYYGSCINSQMNHAVITCLSGSTGYGVYNSETSIEMCNVIAVSTDTTGYGVYNVDSLPIIRGSRLRGTTDGLFTMGGTATVSQSTIQNGANVDDGGTNKCVACDNGSGTPLNSICQ